MKKYSDALQSYWVAASIKNSVEPYEGIIKCLIKLKRLGEATAVSTMIAKKHNKNSRVIVICVDVVLARKCPDYLSDVTCRYGVLGHWHIAIPSDRVRCVFLHIKQAKFLLQKALNINPHCLASVIKYSQILMLDSKYDEALELCVFNIVYKRSTLHVFLINNPYYLPYTLSINSHLKNMDYPILHSLKGDVHVYKGEFHKAEIEYSLALQ